MWFHRPIRADEWFLVDIHPRSVSSGRGLVAGSIYAADGTLGASFAQELLVRPG
jgi:acyl-CoA thioesterase-2